MKINIHKIFCWLIIFIFAIWVRAGQADTTLTTLEAENMSTKTIGGAVTDGWNIWSNGYIENSVTFPAAGSYKLVVRAYGEQANNAWPNMFLRLDGSSVNSATVSATSWTDYTFTINVEAGAHQIGVQYTNDYYLPPADRNLIVDKISIIQLGGASAPVIATITPNSEKVLSTVTINGSGFGDYPITTYNADADLNRDHIVNDLDRTIVASAWQSRKGEAGYNPVADLNRDGIVDLLDFVTVTSSWLQVRPASYVLFGNVSAQIISWTDTQIECTVPWDASSGNLKVVTANGTSNSVNFTVTTAVSLPVAVVEDIQYNANGQVVHFKLGNGTTTDHTYDPLMQRLTRTLTKASTGIIIQDLNYQYDGVGNIVNIVDNVNTASQAFMYDHLDRLVQADNPAKYGTKTYVYDAIGNIKQKDGKNYAYGDGPAGPHAVTSTVGSGVTTTYTYDENGNMATKQTGSEIVYYNYDTENRLIEIKKNNDLIARYRYDGDGGRVEKKRYQGGSVAETAEFIGGLFDKIGSRSTAYIFLGDVRIASIAGDEMFYYHQDHLGGTNVLTDTNGTVKELVEYDPFGDEARHEKYGTAEQVARYYFSNHFKDDESGLIFMQARYYMPSLGRFITPDEIVSKAGNPITMNRYAYAGNNPVMNIDPSGHIFGLIFAAVKAIISFAVAHPFIAGAVVGAASGGITAYQNGGNIFQGIALGGLQGGLAGYTLGLSPGTPGLGAGLGLLKASAAVSLTSQVADAADQAGLAQGLRYGSMALSAAYVGLNVGIGIKDWATSKLNVTDLAGNAASIQSNDNVFVNGILTDQQGALGKAAELNSLKNAGITKVAHNSSSGFIADMTESFLQKVTFTSSVDRQLANMVKGLNNITFTGHSQGTLITGNALLNLGFSDNRSVVTNSLNFSTPLSQPRAAISAAIGGTGSNRFIYANNWGDPINVIGPNINPPKFLSGFGMQIQNH